MCGAGEPGGFGHWGELSFERARELFQREPSANPVGVRKRMPSTSFKTLVRAVVAFACLVGLTAFAPAAGADVVSSGGGGATFTPPPPPEKAKLANGRLIAPASAPRRVVRAITANRIVEKPYRYGGGHQLYRRGRLDSGYDCSGAVSYALYGGRFLRSPLPSGALMSWGEEGPGRWIHGLRARRPRLRRDRRIPLRHLDARRGRPRAELRPAGAGPCAGRASSWPGTPRY